jgi:hypothetical protein
LGFCSGSNRCFAPGFTVWVEAKGFTMKMETVEVYCSEKGFVIICQGSEGDDQDAIILTPEQIPLVIEWLERYKTVAEATTK